LIPNRIITSHITIKITHSGAKKCEVRKNQDGKNQDKAAKKDK
jgi:hypothetical protein